MFFTVLLIKFFKKSLLIHSFWLYYYILYNDFCEATTMFVFLWSEASCDSQDKHRNEKNWFKGPPAPTCKYFPHVAKSGKVCLYYMICFQELNIISGIPGPNMPAVVEILTSMTI